MLAALRRCSLQACVDEESGATNGVAGAPASTSYPAFFRKANGRPVP